MLARKTKNILFALIAGLILSNCTAEESTRKRSFGDDKVKGTELQIQQKSNAEADRLNALLQQVEPIVVSQVGLEKDLIDANLLLTKVITPLRAVVLNTDLVLNMEDQAIRNSDGVFVVKRMVSLFNEAIILVNLANPSMIDSTDLLEKYKSAVLWDCHMNVGQTYLEGTCPMINFYKQNDAPNMSRIMKLIHDRESDEIEKLKAIMAALDMKNRRVDHALRFMLMEQLAKSIQNEKVNKGNVDLLRQRRRRDSSLFANLLAIEIDNITGEDSYLKLIEALNPWELSRNVDDNKNQAMSEIISLASERLLYNSDGELSEAMIEKKSDGSVNGVIANLRYVVDKDYEQGVLFQEKNIKGEWLEAYEQYQKFKLANSGNEPANLSSVETMVFPAVEKSLDVELYDDASKEILNTLLSDTVFSDSDLDEYFYLAHQIYFGHYNLDDAETFWSQTRGRSDNSQYREERLMAEIEKLIKRQIVNNIVFTNVRMNKFYNRDENSTILELLRESDREASNIRKAWAKTIVRAKAAKNLISRVVKPANLNFTARNQYDRINNQVEALPKNIKFLVTYPSMYPLLHVMASQEMQDEIQTFWGKFTIDSNLLIGVFFNGRFPPWFNFGNDGNSLDKTEVLYTYYYALVTQTLETYKNNRLAKFSHEEFFTQVVSKLVLKSQNDLDENKRLLVSTISTFANSAEALKRMCSEEKRLQDLEKSELAKLKASEKNFDWFEAMKSQSLNGKGVMKNRYHVKNQVSFESIGTSIYDATSSKKDKIGAYLSQVYSPKALNVFRSLRQDDAKTQFITDALFEIFEKTYQGDKEMVKQAITKEFGEYNKLKAEYIRLFSETEKEIRNCDWLFAQRDKDLRYLLIFREAEELGKLFDMAWEALALLTPEERGMLSLSNELLNEEQALMKSEALAKLNSGLTHFNRYIKNSSFNEDENTNYPQEEYIDRLGYNRLSATGLTSFQMDTAARVYAYLHEMFPGQYAVTMPTDWKTSSIFRESSPELVFFDWSKADELDQKSADEVEEIRSAAKKSFVNSGIKSFSSQMSWAGSSPAIGDIQRKGQILGELYKLGEQTTNTEIDCQDPNLEEKVKTRTCVSISPEEIVEHHRKAIDFTNIDDLDLEVLEMMGKEEKYEVSTYENLIKKKDEHELYSYYDLMFKGVVSDSSVKSAVKLWFRDELVLYMLSAQKISGSHFIFPPQDGIDRFFREAYSDWVENYLSRNLEFIKDLREEVDQGMEPFDFSYRVDKSFVVGAETNEGSDKEEISLEPFVSDLIYGQYTGALGDLDDDTNKYFSRAFWDYNQEINKVVSPTVSE